MVNTFDDINPNLGYLKAGTWVLGAHVLAIGLLIVGVFIKPHTELVMMAEMIDRQSSALVQNFKKSNDTKEVKDKKEVLKLSDSAAEQASEKSQWMVILVQLLFTCLMQMPVN